MKRLLGSALLVIGHTWLAISNCAMMIVFFFLWVGILIWLATSTWGGFIWAGLWLFIGAGILSLIVGLISLPTRLFGASLVMLGERFTTLEDEAVDVRGLEECMACGSKRVSEDDKYCRACGAPYG